MGRNRLIRAILILCLLYGGIATAVFLMIPASSLAALYDAMPNFMARLTPPASVGIGSMGDWQRLLLIAWTGPLLLAWLGAIILGTACAVCALAFVGKRFRQRARSSEAWQGTTCSLGPLLIPALPHRVKPVQVDCPGVNLSAAQQAMVDEAVGLIAAKPDTFSGDGHGTGLYRHTLNVIQAALSHPDADARLVMAAAAHDIGKLTSYKQVGDSWQKIRDHGIEGGRLLRLLPAFHALDEADATALYPAVRYEHVPDQLPLGTPKAALDLRDRLSAIDGEATADEKADVLASRDPAQELIDAFDRYFGSMPFYRKGLARNEKTVGMRKGRRLYFNEIALREWLGYRIDRDLIAALGRIRQAGEVHALTQHLLRQLHARGQLITEITVDDQNLSMPPEVALWTVRSGKQTFNGMFIVHIPKDSPVVLPEAVPYMMLPLRPATEKLAEQATIRTVEKAETNDAEPDAAVDETSQTASNASSVPSQATQLANAEPTTKADTRPQRTKRRSTGRKARPKRAPRKQANVRTGPWSEDELAVLAEHADQLPPQRIETVARQTGRSEDGVRQMLHEQGALPRKGAWTDAERQFIEDNKHLEFAACVQAVARATGRTPRNVERKVKKYYADENTPFHQGDDVAT